MSDLRLKPVYIPKDFVYDIHIDTISDDAKVLVYDTDDVLVGIITKYGGYYNISSFDMSSNSDYSQFTNQKSIRRLMTELKDQLDCSFKIIDETK